MLICNSRAFSVAPPPRSFDRVLLQHLFVPAREMFQLAGRHEEDWSRMVQIRKGLVATHPVKTETKETYMETKHIYTTHPLPFRSFSTDCNSWARLSCNVSNSCARAWTNCCIANAKMASRKLFASAVTFLDFVSWFILLQHSTS